VPEEVKLANEDYRNDMDPIQRFLDECCIISETCKVKVSQLYDKYEEWCHENKEYVLSSIKFSKKLGEKEFEQVRDKKGRYWKNIGILYDEEQLEIAEVKDNINPFYNN
jgi:putative DNA primase/helicase